MSSANRSSPSPRRQAFSAGPIQPRRPVRRPLAVAISALLLSGAINAQAQSFPLSSLDGSNGFRLDGVAEQDVSGWSISAAGDINGDGIDDVVIGAYGADPNGNSQSGSSYVVFGQNSGFPETIELASLDGSNGFRLDGVAEYDYSGLAVSGAGDVNGDGIDDVVIGAFGADPNGFYSGSSYVLFGRKTSFAAAITLSSLDGSNGFRLDGAANYDRSGYAVSGAGDINGDGIDDLLIGSDGSDPNGSLSGSSYVVFGQSSGFPETIELANLDGSNGFRLDGVAEYDYSGFAVSGAGDVNGDDIDDVVIGAYGADPNGNSQSGSSYVVFGQSSGFPETIELASLDGSNGFRLDGVAEYDYSGLTVSGAGDVNGDGIDDVVIGAFGADPNGFYSGSSYVLFGRKTSFAAAITLSSLDGSNGFRLDGAANYDRSGYAVSGAGDINGDGIDDLLIGSDGSDPNGSLSGSSYVVFGQSSGFPEQSSWPASTAATAFAWTASLKMIIPASPSAALAISTATASTML